METAEKREKRTHHGHAIKRLRQTLGIKQSALIDATGYSQQSISAFEQRPVLEDDILAKFAKALDVSVELIKELEEDPITVIFENNNNTFGDNEKINQGYHIEDSSVNHYNPVEKIVELCERLLEKEQEKIALLEKLLKEKGK